MALSGTVNLIDQFENMKPIRIGNGLVFDAKKARSIGLRYLTFKVDGVNALYHLNTQLGEGFHVTDETDSKKGTMHYFFKHSTAGGDFRSKDDFKDLAQAGKRKFSQLPTRVQEYVKTNFIHLIPMN